MNLKRLATTFNGPLGKLVLGSAGGYAIVLALSPIITRLYNPEEFGQFAIFSSFVAVASVFMSLSLELGILSARRRSEAARYVFLSTASVIIITLAISTILLVLCGLGVNMGLPAWALVLTVVSCSVASLTSVAINWSLYSGRSNLAARSIFSSLSGRGVMQMGFGYVYGGLPGLVLGEVAGRMLALSVAVNQKLTPPVRLLTGGRRLMAADFAAIRPYAFYITPSAAIDTALVWLPAPLFSIFFGPFAGGLIAMTQRFGSVPLTIVNQSLGQLFHRRTAEKFGDDNAYLRRLILLYFGGFLSLTIIAVLLLLWQGEAICRFLLGSAWSGTYTAAIALAPLYLFQFVTLLTNRIILVSGRANIKFLTSVAQLGMLFCAIFFAKWMSFSWETALFGMAGCLALTQCLTILYVLHLLSQKNGGKRPSLSAVNR